MQTSLPMVELGRSTLQLFFDDLDMDVKDYYYRVIHCNADWTPSILNDMDYIDGYVSDRVMDYQNSSRVVVPYTNYRVNIPNDNLRLKKSGNYILKIYENSDEEDVVLTRRFMVVEPLLKVFATIQRPVMTNKIQTHQELDFWIDHKGVTIRNPQNEVKVAVLQNGRWDNAITGLLPVFTKENQLNYDYQDKIVFPAAKEFRQFDLSSTRYTGINVKKYEESKHRWDAFLYEDVSRATKGYVYQPDANGKWVMQVHNSDVPDIEGDYINTHFSLPMPSDIEGGEVYVFGGLSDWEIKEANKMTYNIRTHAYEGELVLKQGIYNYMYAFVKRGEQAVNTSLLEGDWFETENSYTVLVYYRPFGERYDRLVAAQTLNSLRRN